MCAAGHPIPAAAPASSRAATPEPSSRGFAARTGSARVWAGGRGWGSSGRPAGAQLLLLSWQGLGCGAPASSCRTDTLAPRSPASSRAPSAHVLACRVRASAVPRGMTEAAQSAPAGRHRHRAAGRGHRWESGDLGTRDRRRASACGPVQAAEPRCVFLPSDFGRRDSAQGRPQTLEEPTPPAGHGHGLRHLCASRGRQKPTQRSLAGR